MDDRELLIRIERHLERGNEVIDRNTQAMDRSREAMERNGEAMERNGEAMERNSDVILGLRHFAQDLLGRFDAAARAIDATMREQGETMRGLVDMAKAHEEALWAILDQLKALRRADGTA